MIRLFFFFFFNLTNSTPAIAYILRFPRVEDDTHLTFSALSPSLPLHLDRNINTLPV